LWLTELRIGRRRDAVEPAASSGGGAQTEFAVRSLQWSSEPRILSNRRTRVLRRRNRVRKARASPEASYGSEAGLPAAAELGEARQSVVWLGLRR